MNNSDPDQDLRLCRQYGYDAIELRIDMMERYLQAHTMDELTTSIQDSGVRPFSINAIDNINFNTPELWDELRRQIIFSCEIAQKIDCHILVVCPSKSDVYFTMSEKTIFDDTVSVLNRYADLAEPYGVRIAFEPIGDRRWCCNSLRHSVEIIEAVRRESVGLAVDCTNFYMHDKCADLASIYRIPHGKIFVYHINDCEDLPLGVLDQCHRLMPGEGCIPIREITKAVLSNGYTGPACLELFRPAYWELAAEHVFRMGAEKTRPFLVE